MGIRIAGLAEIPPVFHNLLKLLPSFMIGLVDWTKKRVNYLSCIEGKGGLIVICCITQNAVIFISLLKNLFRNIGRFFIIST